MADMSSGREVGLREIMIPSFVLRDYDLAASADRLKHAVLHELGPYRGDVYVSHTSFDLPNKPDDRIRECEIGDFGPMTTTVPINGSQEFYTDAEQMSKIEHAYVA
jgi:hypothetical protein